MALEVGDFVLAEKAFDALGERSDDTVFVLLGLVPVETHIVSLDAELFEVKSTIIATGSEPTTFPNLPFD